MTRRAALIVHRIVVLLVRLAGGIAAALAVLVTLAAWEMSRGPISLDMITPHLARALSNEESGITVAIDQTLVTFSPESKLELVARGVHLTQRGGARLTLPQLEIGLSPRAALHGIMAPTRITLDQPVLRLERDADGTMHFGFSGETAGVSGDWGAWLLADLAKPPDRHGTLGYLVHASIHDAALTVDDRSLGIVWKAERADVSLHRGTDGMRGDLRLAVDVGGRQTEINGVLAYRIAAGSLGLVLRFRDLQPAEWAVAGPAFAQLAVVDVPIGGEIRATIDLTDAALQDVSCDLVFGNGALRHSALVGGQLAIAGGALHAAYDPVSGRVDVTELALNVGGPRVTVAGTVDGVGHRLLDGIWPKALDIAATIEVQNLAVDEFSRFWPGSLSPGTREFVTQQVHAGRVDKAQMQLGVHVDLNSGTANMIRTEVLEGSLAYSNLTVDYFPPLASVVGVSGTATFDRKHVDFVPTTGAIKGTRVTGGTVKLSRLDTDDEQIAIDLSLTGPVRDVLDVLDSKPLRYAHELGIDPAHVGGNFDANIKFAFPLLRKLRFAQVDFGAEASVSGAAIEQVIFGRDLTDGDLKMQLGRSALQLDGTARVAGIPLTLTWVHSLKDSDPVVTRYVVHTQLDDAARKDLGLDAVADRLTGPVGVDVNYSAGADHRAEASVNLELKPAAIAISELGWSKPAGVPASGKLRLQLADDKLVALKEGVLKGGGIDAEVAAAFEPGASGLALARVEIARLTVGKTDITGNVSPRAAGGWRVKLTGPSFDATALADDLDQEPSTPRHDRPLEIEAAFDRVVLGEHREATSVRATMFRDDEHWQAASVDAALSGGGTVSLRFGKAGGDRNFILTSSDYGALLQLLDMSDNVRGGHIQLSGNVEDRGGARVLRGHADGGDYRIVGAPMFARLLSGASFTGIGALLTGEGIPFSRLSAEFTYGDGRFTANNMRAYGSAIGINSNGMIDYHQKTLDVSGTLVPAYLLNSVLGNIPMLGNLLLGGEGQGIFAANFRVAGSLADPRISVNPLSAIAPGRLRDLFLFGAPNPDSADKSTPSAPQR